MPSTEAVKMSKNIMEHNDLERLASSSGQGADLSRQVTLNLSAEQYERLFFAPAPPRGETQLAKRLGNPTLLGLLGFLIPYSSTIFCLIGFQGSVPPTSLIGLYGDYYFLGSIAMNIAGVAEFVLGNSKYKHL